jgi:hypothetical protein
VISEPAPESIARLGAAGVGTVRINLSWSAVQAGPEADFDWTMYDRVVRDSARQGARVLATVYGSPVWAEPTPEHPPLGSALPGFAAFAGAAVERYGSGGSFWSENPDLPALPVTDWELWNEPNSATFWKPAPSAPEYLSLLQAFSAAVEGADPEANVLLGGLFPTDRDGPSMVVFLDQLLRAGAGPLLDAVDVHPYARAPEDALRIVRSARGVMGRFGAGDKPIWITEVGWASSGDPSGITVGPPRQAAYLTRTFQLAAAQRDSLGIAGVIWYSLEDLPGANWISRCGLFTLDGRAKPSSAAMAAVTG